jgi:5-formyltetrahydrofolate cyclo-ligase
MQSDKSALRSYLKFLRSGYPIDDLEKKSLILQDEILNSDIYKNSHTIFCYISIGKEINTKKIINDILANNKTLCVPKVITKSEMTACRLENLDQLKINNFGIPEPVEKIEIPKNMIDLIIVPALCFNKDGYRIGYGGGYYDNYLKDFNGMTFGMVIKEFIIDFIPEKFDIPVRKLFIQ